MWWMAAQAARHFPTVTLESTPEISNRDHVQWKQPG